MTDYKLQIWKQSITEVSFAFSAKTTGKSYENIKQLLQIELDLLLFLETLNKMKIFCPKLEGGKNNQPFSQTIAKKDSPILRRVDLGGVFSAANIRHLESSLPQPRRTFRSFEGRIGTWEASLTRHRVLRCSIFLYPTSPVWKIILFI